MGNAELYYVIILLIIITSIYHCTGTGNNMFVFCLLFIYIPPSCVMSMAMFTAWKCMQVKILML